MLGRVLTDEDDKAASSPAAVLSYRYWQQRLDEPVADVVWRRSFRPADLRRDCSGVDAGGAGGVFHPGVAGDESGSDDCVKV